MLIGCCHLRPCLAAFWLLRIAHLYTPDVQILIGLLDAFITLWSESRHIELGENEFEINNHHACRFVPLWCWQSSLAISKERSERNIPTIKPPVCPLPHSQSCTRCHIIKRTTKSITLLRRCSKPYPRNEPYCQHAAPAGALPAEE